MDKAKLFKLIIEFADGYFFNMPDRMTKVYAKHLSEFSEEAIVSGFRQARMDRPEKMQTAYQLVKWCTAAERDINARKNYKPVIEQEEENLEPVDHEKVKRMIADLKAQMKI